MVGLLSLGLFLIRLRSCAGGGLHTGYGGSRDANLGLVVELQLDGVDVHFVDFSPDTAVGDDLVAPEDLSIPLLQYADFSYWQQQLIEQGHVKAQLAYWTGQLADLPICHSVPLDFARPASPDFRGLRYYQDIPKDIADAIKLFAFSISSPLILRSLYPAIQNSF